MSQEKQILEHLLSGKPITPLEALSGYDCFRLSSVIHRLRKKGYDISTELIGDKGYGKYQLNLESQRESPCLQKFCSGEY